MLFIVDFDGTVAPRDTVDALLDRFADPSWKTIEEEWTSGRLNSRDCMQAQLALVTAERPVLEEFFQSVAIDPSFVDFVRCVRTFAEVAVVSDGLDYPIRRALQKRRVPPLPVFANRLEFRARGLGISFPHSDATCGPQSGVCKCSVARSLNAGRGLPVILIGDGRSDLCLAGSAEHVFAKGSLQRYCQSQGIAHTAFDSFDDVIAVIRTWDAAHFNHNYEMRHAR
jgi:2-hydroxy-3-keto-5-methylthiopentenyl-1-phosphate phosphatase